MNKEPRATDKITLRRIDDDIWMEYYETGVRFRFELNQEDIDSLAEISKLMSEELREHLSEKRYSEYIKEVPG